VDAGCIGTVITFRIDTEPCHGAQRLCEYIAKHDLCGEVILTGIQGVDLPIPCGRLAVHGLI